jgi:hypothetical protein
VRSSILASQAVFCALRRLAAKRSHMDCLGSIGVLRIPILDVGFLACPRRLMFRRYVMTVRDIIRVTMVVFGLFSRVVRDSEWISLPRLVGSIVSWAWSNGRIQESEIVMERIERSLLNNLLPKLAFDFAAFERLIAVASLRHFGVRLTIVDAGESGAAEAVIHHIVVVQHLHVLIPLFRSQYDE